MPYQGGKREKATLKYEREIYTPQGAKNLPDKDLRKEYSRLRSIARKRLERFEGTEWTDTQVYQLNNGLYKPLKEIKSNAELRHLFSDVARFVDAKSSSVSGLEKQRATGIKTLNDRGYEFVNKGNFRQFVDFMEYARTANMGRMYDSKRVADFYQATEKKDMPTQDIQDAFRSWRRNQKKLKKIQHVNPRNSSMYRKDVD